MNAKPKALPPNFDAIPEALKQWDHWVVWRYEFVKGRWTKPPYNPLTGEFAKTNDPNTWCDYETAVKAYHEGGYDGIGFCFGKTPYFGVDGDVANDDPRFSDLVALFSDTYCEFSPSGRFHALGFGKPKAFGHYDGTAIEVFADESFKYFTVTGRNIPGTALDLTDGQKPLDDLYERYKGGEGKPSHDSPTRDKREIPFAIRKLIELGVPEGERSEAIASVVTSLHKTGYGRLGILKVLMDPRNGISERPREKGEKATLADIDRLVEKFDRRNGLEADAPSLEDLKKMDAEMGDYGTAFDPFDRSSPEGFPDPKPLPEGLHPVPSLPDSLIPELFRSWLADIAERLQVPLEYPTVAAIVCLASVIGNRVLIRPKRRDDWMVAPNLWGGIVGRPGTMKSPAIAEPMKALYRLVKEAEAAYMEAMRDWGFEKTAADVRKDAIKDKMKKAAKDGKKLDHFREQMREEPPQEPCERRYIVNDSTVEKYGELLNQNPNGLLIFRDELTGWLRSLDDERRANDRAFFLEAWNGDKPYVYDRIVRGTLKIEVTTTSVLGGIQPRPLETYLRGALGYGEGDDGLMQRFQMLVYPDIPPDWRNVDRWPETAAKNRAFEIFKRLSEINPFDIGAQRDIDGWRPYLQFTPAGQELFDEWRTELNRALRAGEFEHPALEAHFAKYNSLMPSLALTFHLIDMADGKDAGPVSLGAAELAAAWCEFLGEHAQRVYGLGFGAAAIHAKTLAKHIRQRDLSNPFTSRDVYIKCWSGLSSPKEVEEPLALLESLNWLRSVDIQTGGRPTVHYYINPRIAEAEK